MKNSVLIIIIQSTKSPLGDLGVYYSTNNSAPFASLQQAVVKGLAPDKGLYMPETIAELPNDFFDEIGNLSLINIAKTVAHAFFGEDIPKERLDEIVADTLNFEIPLVKIEEGIYVLELFHGPTFAFKDVGARFMARMLSYFVKNKTGQCKSAGCHFGRYRKRCCQRFFGS